MIMVVSDVVRMTGDKCDLEVETIEILYELYKHGTSKKALHKLVDLATMSDEELHKKAMDVIEKVISELGK